MEKKFFVIIIILFIKSIISEKSLTLEVYYNPNSYAEVTTRFSDESLYYISFSHSKLISKEASNLENINITDDDAYPSKKTKSGLLGKKYFQIGREINLNLNYVNNNGTKNYLGFARGVEYDDKEIEEKYNLDFVSQLIEQNIIDKYYIYLPAFFDEKGELLPKLYLTLGMIPYILDKYLNQTSYAPLNNKYPKKWSLNLSHIIYEDTFDSNNPIKMHYPIYADVIFTNSGNRTINVPWKYRDIFDDIFISHLNCKISFEKFECDLNKINEFKLFFVFNGFSHLLLNKLITEGSTNQRSFYIKFDKDIDFIGIDTYTFGNYHFFFDGENNFIRLMSKKEGFISDVSDIYGYENRDGVPRKIQDMQYLIEWEERLKNESKKINETLEEIEKTKKELEKEKKTLEEEIKVYRSDVLRQEIDNLRKDLEAKEKDKNEIIDNLRKDLESKEKDKNVIIDNLKEDLETKEKDKNETINNLRKDFETKEKDKIALIDNLEKDKNVLNE